MQHTRPAQIIATGAGSIFLLALVTGCVWLLDPDGFVPTAIIANAIALLVAFANWTGVLYERGGGRRHPPIESWQGWIGMFLVALILSTYFLWIDCGWHLPPVLGGTACERRPGLDLIFTVAALAMAAIALPSALRAWLLARLSR